MSGRQKGGEKGQGAHKNLSRGGGSYLLVKKRFWGGCLRMFISSRQKKAEGGAVHERKTGGKDQKGPLELLGLERSEKKALRTGKGKEMLRSREQFNEKGRRTVSAFQKRGTGGGTTRKKR